MSESDSAVVRLSVPEINLLLLLDSAGTTLHGRDGSLRWALNAEDVCDLLELAVDLLADWGSSSIGAAAVRARAASLLGTTAAVAVDGQGSSR
jgi:hypothetical protein